MRTFVPFFLFFGNDCVGFLVVENVEGAEGLGLVLGLFGHFVDFVLDSLDVFDKVLT